MAIRILLALGFLGLALPSLAQPSLQPVIVTPTGHTLLRSSNSSTLYQLELPPSNGTAGTAYDHPPLLLSLKGTRKQIGYDYAALLHAETSESMTSFLSSLFPGLLS